MYICTPSQLYSAHQERRPPYNFLHGITGDFLQCWGWRGIQRDLKGYLKRCFTRFRKCKQLIHDLRQVDLDFFGVCIWNVLCMKCLRSVRIFCSNKNKTLLKGQCPGIFQCCFFTQQLLLLNPLGVLKLSSLCKIHRGVD